MRFDRKASKELVFFKICCTFTYMYRYVPCSSIYKFSTPSFRELYKKESKKIKRRGTKLVYLCSPRFGISFKAETSLPCLDYRRKRADLFQVFWYCKGFDLQNGDQLFIVEDKVHEDKGHINIYQAETLSSGQ